MFNVEGLFVRPPLVRWVGLTLGKKNTLLFSLSATNDDSLLAVSDGIGWVGVSLPPSQSLSRSSFFFFYLRPNTQFYRFGKATRSSVNRDCSVFR